VLAGISDLASQFPGLAAATEILIHGTTLVINAIVERKGSATALLTTRGFRDMLEMRNEQRYDKYDLFQEFPAPLVPRPLRFGVSERMHASGEPLEPLDREEVRRIAATLVEHGVESVAIVFLHAYVNSAHEEEAARVVAAAAPDLTISQSHRVLPEIREYERVSTTVANAYVKPLIERYLEALAAGLHSIDYAGPLYLMNSGGGLTSVETARELPVRIVESGPAGGVIATQFYGRLAGDANLLAFDMGGTTAKACLIRDGEISVRSDYEIARMVRFKRGSGLSLRVPVVDILEVGAGGGSIAHPSGLGLLQVGPESAGATPGPASYGQGGALPTVTDADVLLGYLDPGYFLGGAMALDVEAASAAMAHGLAAPLGVSVETATWGVHDVVNEYMASAIKTYLLERGQDPTSVSLVAFGGAGPVHAYGVARKLGMRRVFVPPAAGAMSALGFLLAPPAIELARTYKAPLREFDGAVADRHCDAMRAEARRLLPALGRAEPTYALAADMRYVGQGYEIRVALPGARLAGLEPSAMQAAFEAGYLATYGRTYPDTEAEVINLRVLAALPALPFTPRRLSADGSTEAALKGRRPATFGPGMVVECPVYERYRLPAGATIEGPAIVEERESTTVCGPDSRLRVDPYGILAMELGVAAGIGAAPRGGRA